ncbi:transcriptional regulator GcvA [uncultured Ferrovibrio sp.]|jgi:LysR family glycine cleavage system transcriptional activator|uniref:transcriptional regulator GcvA n=1 Tax=uncultured Ferrovibrio sp. TaxID=1576913 RepID=UPI00262D2CBA|nr:transcriptional regulator GcvA [uncultured Ferrovibrio sp.]
MARRLPPLNALRVFEAAARHLSFTKAAEELNVTQAAVSHQVKLLEEILGLALFRRYNRRLVLTEAGQAYLPALRDAFDLMDAATRRLSQQSGPKQLRISTLQSFAMRWLVPRAGRFSALHPDIDLMISTSSQLVDFRRDDIDLAIRLGSGKYPDLHAVHLADDYVFPVCSPRLLEGPHPLRRLEDLKHHTLLHDTQVSREARSLTWETWLRRNNVTDIDAGRGMGYSDTGMAIQAAIAGQGVALGRKILVLDDLAAGLLVKPFDIELKNHYSYYLVCPKALADTLKVKAFLDWLVDEIARSEACLDVK